MSALPLHRLTAVFLAVLYGLVGVTGESLHYLATDPAANWSNQPAADVVVYYHTHGPDYHGHFHRHVHPADHSHAEQTAAHNSRADDDSSAVRSEALTHDPHACPLLSLVSTLKLGYAAARTSFECLAALVTPRLDRDDDSPSKTHRLFCARGPPAAFIA